MQRAITALILPITFSAISIADSQIETDSILSGLRETKLIFSCEHPDAKIMFQVTKEAMYMLSEDGLLVATDGMKKDNKQCPNITQIPVDD